MNSYLSSLKAIFETHTDQAKAGPMQAYMRDQFLFLGIRSPERNALLREFFADQGPPPIDELSDLVTALWDWPEREYQYAAQALIDKVNRQHHPEHIDLFEKTIITKSWWDTNDWTASHPVGDLFRRFPETRDETIAHWRVSDDFWLRRVSMLFQLRYKAATNVDLLFDLIRENLGSSEFFINKAIGWTLREYSKTDADTVKRFVADTDLAPLSHKEALKWLARRGEA